MAMTKKEHQRKYYLKHKDKVCAKSKLYYSENKPKVLKRLKEQYKENPVLKIISAKKYVIENPDKPKKYQKTWKERHPEKRKLYIRNSRIRAYGVSPETYYEMLKKQGQGCAICKAKSLRRAMNIDHNHTTGKVRGLLCDNCNLMLGVLEKKDFTEKALKYLNQYK